MIEKHYKSDFEFTEVHDESILLAPFKFTYYIEGNRSQFVVAYDGSTFHNCRYENGRLIIAYKGGTLGMGVVSVIRQFFLTNENFNDGMCNIYSSESTDLYLGDGYTDNEGDVEMELFPYYQQGKAGKDAYQEWLDLGNTGTVQDFLDSLRGEPLKYEDLTEDEKTDLANHLDIPNGSITEKKLSQEVQDKLNKGGGTSFSGNASDVTYEGVVDAENVKQALDTLATNMITTEDAEGEEVEDFVLMASDVEQSLGDSTKPISQAAVRNAINSIESMIVSVINTPI